MLEFKSATFCLRVSTLRVMFHFHLMRLALSSNYTVALIPPTCSGHVPAGFARPRARCSLLERELLVGRPVKRAREEEEEREQGSQTVDKLLELVGRGRIDVTCATDVARAVLGDTPADCAAPPLRKITRLASLGCSGSHQQNAERDLYRWLKNNFDLRLQTYEIVLELQARCDCKLDAEEPFIAVSALAPEAQLWLPNLDLCLR